MLRVFCSSARVVSDWLGVVVFEQKVKGAGESKSSKPGKEAKAGVYDPICCHASDASYAGMPTNPCCWCVLRSEDNEKRKNPPPPIAPDALGSCLVTSWSAVLFSGAAWSCFSWACFCHGSIHCSRCLYLVGLIGLSFDDADTDPEFNFSQCSGDTR